MVYKINQYNFEFNDTKWNIKESDGYVIEFMGIWLQFIN